ncbi:MAG: biopolymer transporter ExbD [Planctomycetes bacterium]|nr:biopolymer transporter ExbD [Planctomycetota bacterium]
MKRKKRDAGGDASFDLTPMIDCVFQLLIFFIVCTRFKMDERNHRADLPTDEGLSNAPAVPKEQVTVYCQWNGTQNEYVVAIGARNRQVVPESRMGLTDLVIFPSDGVGDIRTKKQRYGLVHGALVEKLDSYIQNTGAKIEKLEISFAKDAVKGAKSGTAPWCFVSLAIDAAAQLNKNREANGKDKLSVTFKFADALSAG